MNDAQELNDLVELLYEKTKNGRVTWSMSGSSLITTRLGKNVVELMEVNPSGFYQMTVRNEDGLALSSTMFGGKMEAMELFGHVKRTALGVDEALHDIKSRLQAL